MTHKHDRQRRRLLGAMGAMATWPLLTHAKPTRPVLHKTIPRTGVELPAVGMGTWITFNVGNDAALRQARTDVVRAFLDAGGAMIDSSPMYGSSQAVVGAALDSLGREAAVFSTDKIWTRGDGEQQLAETARRWGVSRFDLLQVHNLLNWEEQLPMLMALRADGALGHVGVTTSHGRRHRALADIMRREALDFVQLTYNPLDREAEARLLPLAEERGMAVIVNRPFRTGALTTQLLGKPLPGVAGELGAASWAQLIIKYIVSHPAVTVVIPATTRVDHVRENLAAATGPQPDAAQRKQIAAAVREAA